MFHVPRHAGRKSPLVGPVSPDPSTPTTLGLPPSVPAFGRRASGSAASPLLMVQGQHMTVEPKKQAQVRTAVIRSAADHVTPHCSKGL